MKGSSVGIALAHATRRWNEFWFEPQLTSTLALVRILFGVVVLAWSLSLLPDLGTFFSAHGLLAQPPKLGRAGAWSLLSLSSSPGVVTAVYVALLFAAVCLILGVGGRLATVVVWLAVMAFTRRNPYVFNSGDGYLRIVAFYLVLAPTAASLSLRRWRTDRPHFWEFERRSLWGLRLLQVQVCILYLSAFWDKLRSGPLWNDGTALSFVLRIKDVDRFPAPGLATNGVAINLMTYGTLALELALGVLVWNKRLRPWVLALGVVFHLGIDFSIRVGFFSFVAIVGLLSFVSPDASARAIGAVRDRVREARRHRPGLAATDGIPAAQPTARTPG